MIKFFRKIRQNLIAENKMGKYFKYAIGEILLVVIGILIAVGINSWYNEVQNEQKIEAILTQVQNELLIDISDAKRIYNFYIQKDSLSRKIMNDEVTVEMWKENRFSVEIAYRYVSFSNKKGGYERLMNNLENLPERYTCVLPHFNTLYVELQNDVDDYNLRVKTTVYGTYDDYGTNPKFRDFVRGKYPDEAAAFFVNDPFLKNRTATFIHDLGNIAAVANDYLIESTVLYKKIDSLLGKEITDYPDLLSILPKKEFITPYLGEYTRVGGTMKFDNSVMSFSLVEGQLNFHIPEEPAIPMYWHDDLYFFEEDNIGIYRFYTNEKGKHALEISDGQDNLLYVLKSEV